MREEENKRFQFYGRRSGKTLRRHHLQLMEELLPAVRVDLNDPLPAGEVWLEIGFGGGEHLAHQAATYPHINFIGAEPFRNGIAKLLAHMEEKALTNIRVHDAYVPYLLDNLPPAPAQTPPAPTAAAAPETPGASRATETPRTTTTARQRRPHNFEVGGGERGRAVRGRDGGAREMEKIHDSSPLTE